MVESKKLNGYVKLRDLAEFLGTGIYVARSYGEKVGAERRVGRLLVYDMDVIKKSLDAQKEAPEVKEG